LVTLLPFLGGGGAATRRITVERVLFCCGNTT
jgi:hypothetical protein